jgi:cardiolipin synthase
MNIPNLLTVARFCLVPVVVYMIGQGQWTLAFAIFVIAGLTDAVDGFIARKFDQRTVLGAYIDPLADKALLVSIYVTLAVGGVIPSWLAILVVSRDLMILGAVMVSWLLDNPVEINPLYVSKANTFAQIAFAAVALGSRAFDIELGRGLMGLALVTGALTVVSTGAYLGLWFRHMAADDA